MSSQAIGQRFKVSRGGWWQCVADCRSRLAEALMFFRVAYNVEAMRRRSVGMWEGLVHGRGSAPCFSWVKASRP